MKQHITKTIPFTQKGIVLFSSFLLLFPLVAHANTLTDQFGGLFDGLTSLIYVVIGTITSLVILVFFWNIAGSLRKVEKQETADVRNRILYGILAIFILLSFMGLYTLVSSFFTGGAS